MTDDRTPRPATIRTAPPHGTRARYVHRTIPCRCDSCKAANARYITAYRNGTSGKVWTPRRWEQLELPR